VVLLGYLMGLVDYVGLVDVVGLTRPMEPFELVEVEVGAEDKGLHWQSLPGPFGPLGTAFSGRTTWI